MKSYEQLENIQNQLTSLSDSIRNMYVAMKNECMREIFDDKQKYVTQKNEMYSLYEKLEGNISMRMTWIKNKTTNKKYYGTGIIIRRGEDEMTGYTSL